MRIQVSIFEMRTQPSFQFVKYNCLENDFSENFNALKPIFERITKFYFLWVLTKDNKSMIMGLNGMSTVIIWKFKYRYLITDSLWRKLLNVSNKINASFNITSILQFCNTIFKDFYP